MYPRNQCQLKPPRKQKFKPRNNKLKVIDKLIIERDSYLAPNFSNFKPSYILKHAIDPKNINDDNSKQSQKSAIIDIIYKQESSISIDNKKNLEINDTSNFVPNLNDDSKNALDVKIII